MRFKISLNALGEAMDNGTATSTATAHHPDDHTNVTLHPVTIQFLANKFKITCTDPACPFSGGEVPMENFNRAIYEHHNLVWFWMSPA